MNESDLHILFVEDVPTDVELAQRVLKKDGLVFESQVVDTRDAFVAALEQFRPDIIISDYSMPMFDGMQALQLSLARDALLPFVVLTASHREETAVECIKAGASDYVLKDRMSRLPFAVRDALEQQRIRHEKQAAERALREQMDLLTSIFESSSSILMLVDEEGQVTKINRAGENFTGRSAEELTHLLAGQVFQCVNALKGEGCGRNDECKTCPVRTRLNRTFAGSESFFNEAARLIVRKNGEERPIDFFISTAKVNTNAGKRVLVTVTDISALKQTEQALRESEKRFRTIVRASPVAIAITRLSDSQILDVNAAWEQLIGRTRAEAVGRSALELGAWANSRERQHLIAQLREKGRVENFELDLQRKTGEIAKLLMSAESIEIEGDPCMLAMSIDITERKRVEAIAAARVRIVQFSLSHSLEDILQNVLDECEALTGSCIGFFHFMEADQTTLSLQNWSARTVKEFCTAEGKGTHYSLNQAGVWADCVRQRRAIIVNDYAALTNRQGLPPGHAVVNRYVSIPILRGDQIVGIVGVGNKSTDYGERDVAVVTQLADLSWDIAERKRAEETLRRNEAHLRGVFENSPDTVCTIDLSSGKTELLSRENFCGYSKSDLQAANSILFAVHPDDLAAVKEYWQEVKAGLGAEPFEFRLRRKEGTLEWIQERTVVLSSNPDGSPKEIMVILSIITRRKRAEAIAAARARILQFSFTHTVPEIAQLLLDECEVLTESSSGFFHFMLADQNTLELQNWSTRTRNEFCAAEGQGLHYPLDQAGVWADCVRQRRAIIANDYAAMPNRRGMPPGHALVERFLSVPIFRGDQILAVVGVGNKPTDYDDQDLDVVTRLADLTWDITERKRTEEALQASETRYRSLFQSAAVPIWEEDFSRVKAYLERLNIQDLDAYLETHLDELAHCASLVKVLSVNTEGVEIFQANHQDELLRHNIADYFAEGSWQVFKEELCYLMQGRARFTSELPFLDSTGRTRQSLLHLSVVPGYEKTLERVLLSFIDVTERKEMQEALSTLSRRLFEAQEAERRNVARELHDEIGQVLTAVKSNLQTSKLLSDREMSASFLDESIGIVDKALQQVRDLSLDLRPSMLDDFGLVPALEWYLNRQARRSNFAAEFVAVPREMELPQALATTCFRVAQAALTNIERHAQAKNVRVELHLRHVRSSKQGKHSELRLAISDDGLGFETDRVLDGVRRGVTMGLAGMQERVWLAGGQIEFHSQPGKGTEITARFPVLQPRVERRTKRRTL